MSAVPTGKLHADEVDCGPALVRRLLAAQFPHWANLAIAPDDVGGTDNAIYRLGDERAVRLPRIASAAGQVDKEHHWMPRLAPWLSLPIPTPLARGAPGEGYPWHWSVYRWLEGANATVEPIADLTEAAAELARFIAGLRRVDAAGGPPPGAHNSSRGVALAERDTATRAAMSALRGELDVGAAAAAWDAALQAAPWHAARVWIHGDLQPGNLLVQHGRLSAVIDFGCLGVGDPACDLMVAWNLLCTESREVLRTALAVDDATWARGRGWALSVGLIALAYYRASHPGLAAISRRAIDEVLAAHRRAA